VSVYLPRAASASAAAVEPTGGENAGGSIEGRLVLVVDDDDAVRGVTADELRSAGCRVIEASDGAGGLAALEAEHGIEAAIADFAMPGMNGAEFARRALEQRPALPIVFVTGYADLSALAHVPEENVIQKPYAAGVIADRLRMLIDPAEEPAS
jgi:CheY-like chemotaxis protein